MTPQIVGWSAAGILFATLALQVYRQWRDGSYSNVSRGLFKGQMIAAAGFLLYALMIDNWVFVASNTGVLLVSGLGEAVCTRNGRRLSRNGRR